MSSSTLHACPACDYALYGLPERSFCPECGFEYDKRSHVLREEPGAEGARKLRILSIAILFALMVWLAISPYAIALLLVGVVGMIIASRGLDPPQRVVLAPDCIAFIKRSPPHRIVPFANVSHFEHSRFLGIVRVKGFDGESIARIPEAAFEIGRHDLGTLPEWNEHVRLFHQAKRTANTKHTHD